MSVPTANWLLTPGNKSGFNLFKMILNGQNSINPSNYFEKLPKRALKTPAFKARFLIFVVTDIGQSNKTELNNSRRIILRRNYLALKTFGR